ERGWRPALQANGLQALATFGKSLDDGAPFSLVRLDHMMPGMDGYEAAKKIRLLAKNEPLVIIILSSAPGLADPRRLKKLGIDRTLIKPLRRATLFEAIRNGLKPPAPSEQVPTRPHEMGQARGLRLLLVRQSRESA